MFIPIGSNHPLERTPWATISIIALTVLSQYLDLGVGAWLIPIPVFQHGAFVHLLFNMLFLWVFGSYLEVRIGWLAFVAFYILCELGTQLVYSVMLGGYAIGASGAISGIMALYLVRFYHSRIRTLFWLGPFPIRFNLPVMFLIPFWFSRDILFGVMGMVQVTKVAYFAHVGGLLTGLVIAKVMKFDVEGKTEHFKLRAARRIAESEEMHKVLPDLQKALAENYNDPEIHHLLGQYYARSSANLQMAKKYYYQAMNKYLLAGGEPLKAAGVFLEMIEKCGADRALENYLKYAAIFEQAEDHERALALLSQILDRDDLSGETGKRGLARLISNARAVGETELEVRAEDRFQRVFPDTEIPKPDSITASSTLVLPASKEQLGGPGLSPWKWLDEMMNTWVFWFWWTIVFLPVVIFVQPLLSESIRDGSILLAIIIPTIVAAAATHFYLNSGNMVGGFIFGTGYRKSEKQALRAFNISTYFRNGVASEKEGRYEDAVTYYKGVLEEDPNHIEARLKLAGIYHYKLVRKGSAIHEYDKLINILPETTPHYRTVKKAMEDLLNGVRV